MPDTPDPNAETSASNLASDALRAAQDAVARLESASAASAPPGDVNANADEALKAAQASVAQVQSVASPAPASAPQSFTPPTYPGVLHLPSFGDSTRTTKPEGIDLLSDVNLHVKIELGRTRMIVEDVLRLGEGSVVELDKLAGDPVDVYVNDRHVARGEVLVLNDNFCIRVNEILSPTGESAE
ncbi:MAG: flagellar motor switch protein FliN [Phycisphaerales bacterium]